MHLYHWKSTKLAPFFAIGCVNMHLICWTKFTHFSQFIFWNACFLFEFVAQSAFILLKHFFPSWLFAIGFINTQLFRWKSSNFAFFLRMVVEKWNFFADGVFEMQDQLWKYSIILSKISEIHIFLRLSYFTHILFFNCTIFS